MKGQHFSLSYIARKTSGRARSIFDKYALSHSSSDLRKPEAKRARPFLNRKKNFHAMDVVCPPCLDRIVLASSPRTSKAERVPGGGFVTPGQAVSSCETYL